MSIEASRRGPGASEFHGLESGVVVEIEDGLAVTKRGERIHVIMQHLRSTGWEPGRVQQRQASGFVVMEM